MFKILVTRAGSSSANNAIRAVNSFDPKIDIIGITDDPFQAKLSIAPENEIDYDIASACRKWGIDLVIPTSDDDVKLVASDRDLGILPPTTKTYLPRTSVIHSCQDKNLTGMVLQKEGLPLPKSQPIITMDDVGMIFHELGSPLWCRTRKGHGAFAGLKVNTPKQAKHWIECWNELRGVSVDSFMLSEYLPGLDVSVQCLLQDGILVGCKMHEKLKCLTVGASLSGVTSSAAVAETFYSHPLCETATRAIKVLDDKTSGVFFVDFKADNDGRFCITEINPGRFVTIAMVTDLGDPKSMVGLYIKAAMGIKLPPWQEPTGFSPYFVLRSLDHKPIRFRKGSVV